MKRLHIVDTLRGLVMVIMALDHLRDFVHESALTVNPTDLSKADTALFFTRWITHICAPTFVFLSGVSAYIYLKKSQTSHSHLLIRGFWLIFLDFTVINFGLWFDIHFPTFLFNVLAAIGFGFIILGLISRLNSAAIGIIGLAIIVFHGLFPLLPNTTFKHLITPLFTSTGIPFLGNKVFIMGYPPIPWLGVMLLGYGLAPFILKENRKTFFLKIGTSFLLLFTILRYFNLYGDPALWADQRDSTYTLLSFINVSKYPPSLLFCLLTLGIQFIIAYLLEGKRIHFLEVFGKVPLFYFLIHWFILHALQFALIILEGFQFQDLKFGTNFGRPIEWQGVSLVSTYLLWIVAIIILYPICQWYGRYKMGKSFLRFL